MQNKFGERNFLDSTERIQKQIDDLAEFNSTPGNGVTRVVYTQEDQQAKTYVKELMNDIGLEITEDAIGNIYGRFKGTDPTLSPIWSGSHLDAVPNGGKFDGVVGVLGAIEALRMIKDSGLRPKRDLVAVIFASEEPTRFGIGCLGSRALIGDLTEKDLKTLKDQGGQSLYDVMRQSGYSPEYLPEVVMHLGEIGAFIELHIEQGIVLERERKCIGLIHAIAAPTDIALTLEGEQQHAGATPMNLRKDPVPAAAEVILAAEKWAKENTSAHTVATVGRIDVQPGSSNVIADSVQITIDSRDVSWENKELFLSELRKTVEHICTRRGIKYDLKVKAHDKPMQAHPFVVQKLEESCSELMIDYKLMASGAYHDALMMAKIAPFGMIFVPSKNGISHDKREWTDLEYIGEGVKVLTHSLIKLANTTNFND